MAFPLMGVLAGAGVLGKLFGGAAKGASDNRAQQNQFQAQQNQQALQQYGIEQGAKTNLSNLQEQATMNRAQMGIAAPQQRMKQALLASILQNLQSAKVTPPAGVRMGQLSGGIDPSRLINPAARAGGAEMQKQALLALLTGSDTPGPTDYLSSGRVQAPSLGGFQGPGKGESILSTLGLLGSIGGGVGEAYGAYQGAKPRTGSAPINLGIGAF